MTSSKIKPIIGYIGLGNMGRGVVQCIARAGYTTYAYDIRPQAIADIITENIGVLPAESTVEIAQKCDIVGLAVLNDSQILETVCAPETGLLTHMKSNSVIFINSTVRPQTMRQLETAAQARGVGVCDAAMSGGAHRANEGTLTIFSGGDKYFFDMCQPIFETFASSVFHAGPAGSGTALKISNNIMALGNQIIAMEAMDFARAHGITESLVVDAASVSTGNSWAIQNWGFFDKLLFEHTLADSPRIFHFLVKELHDAVVSAYELGDIPVHLPGTAVLSECGPAAYRQRKALLAEREEDQ